MTKRILVLKYPRVRVEDLTLPVKVDQVGYLPGRQKLAFVSSKSMMIDPSVFEVINSKTGKVVHTGRLQREGKDLVSPIYLADFTELETPGTYQLRVLCLPERYPFTISEEELIRLGYPLSPQFSFPFRVSADVYDNVYYKSMRSYYLQRCGQEIDDPISGLKHGACHTEDALLRSDENSEVRLCWEKLMRRREQR